MAREVRLVWIVVAALLTVVVVTYARVPTGDLYNVSTGGLGGGFGRAVVELNYPVALVALGVLGVTAPLLGRRRRALAVLAASLCLVVTALSLSRVPNRITLFLALMLAYGV